MAKISKSFQYGNQTVTLETGEIARQADGAVIASMGDTAVMTTVVASREARGGDFFPLTVDYQEKAYAAGRIPGNFFRREGRLSEEEVLTCRLIDRPIRPLFPKGFTNEVQIIVTVISSDPEIDPDVISLISVSAALKLSGVPFSGPIGAARVGYADGQYILNPTAAELKTSDLDLIVAGTTDAVLMVESEARLLPEDVMLGAVVFGHEQQQAAIKAINELTEEAKVQSWKWEAPEANDELFAKIADMAESDMGAAYLVADKLERQEKLGAIRDKIMDELVAEDTSDEDREEIQGLIKKLEKKIVRGRILAGEPRIDGRDTRTVRPITVRTGVLPRTHGSALFTRGETQALVVTTLGTQRDAQRIDALEGEVMESFMLHYNFPPYCVGEVGRIGGTKRREHGHGRLAKRGILGVMPDMETYPYSVRVVSEITESNGSSSMASVCGTSLSLMDAGVETKAPVAGVAMGLIKDGDKFAVLTDILGDEDHLGDMDFKVAGSENGITALQMDIKIEGITKEIMQIALDQAKEGRLHILGIMNEAISEPRAEMSDHAPRVESFKINPDKIRDVIGKGGATIRGICESTGANVDINDDGMVTIFSADRVAGQEARKQIEQLTADVEVGTIYEGRVNKLMDFGAFVTILPGKDGLVHISQISHERVEKVSDKLNEGDTVRVKVLEIDRQGRIRLSMKAVDGDQKKETA